MSNKEELKKKKKEKLPFRRAASNILFALKQVWQVSPAYFIIYYLVTLIYAPLDFLTDSFLLRMIVNKVEAGDSISSIVTYIIVLAAVAIVINMVSSFYWNVI